MISAWRIVRRKYADSAFTGAGAFEYGGRWNSRGHHVVYTSETRALAALETLIHLPRGTRLDYVIIGVEFDAQLVKTLPLKPLPPNWRSSPAPIETMQIGDDWIAKGDSPVLRVPSVLIPQEFNYLLNPNHPDFAQCTVSTPEPFSFDPRLTEDNPGPSKHPKAM